MVWLSVYLFYDDSLDFFLINGVRPFINKVDKIITNWFFIRYAENGQHIRLRLKVDENQAKEVELEIENYFGDFFQKFASKNHLNNRFELVNYEPETARYGGTISLEISEQYFQYASEFILEYLDETTTYENKLLIAALMNYNLALVYFDNENERNAFFEQIANDWLHFNCQYLELPKQEIIKQIKTIKAGAKATIQPLLKEYLMNYKNGIEDDFSDWRKQNFAIKQQLSQSTRTKPIPQILESYVHLNNNRFGISNFDESLVSDLLIED